MKTLISNLMKLLINMMTFLVVLLISQSANAQWTDVGSPITSLTGYGDFEKDASGNLYVAHRDASNAKARVKKFNGTTWNSIGNYASHGLANYLRLAVSPNGNRLYTICRDGGHGHKANVKYSTGGNWTNLGPNGITTSGVTETDIAIGTDINKPYIVFRHSNQWIIQQWSGSNWTTIGTFNYNNGFVQLKANDSGDLYLVISFHYYTTYVFKYNGGSSWSQIGSLSGEKAQITFDASGVPYVAIRNTSSTPHGLSVIKYSGTPYSWNTIGSPNFVTTNYLEPNGITIDANDNVFVTFVLSQQNYVYGYDGSSWNQLGPTGMGLPTSDSRSYNIVEHAGNPTIAAYAVNSGTAIYVTTYLLAPEINVNGNAQSLTDGQTTVSASDLTDFGQTVVGTPVVNTFTIENTGYDTLNISGVNVSGSNAFSIVQNPASNVDTAASTTFQVSFNPTGPGAYSATISINNDDADENPFDFAVYGLGPVPEINVKGNGQNIADGSTSTATSDNTDFGTSAVGSSVNQSFVIENTGNSDLNISGINISGSGASAYTLSQAAPVAISANSTGSFQVTYNPTATGIHSATVEIDNDDLDEDPYEFAIVGQTPLPEIVVTGNSVNIHDGSSSTSTNDSTDFGLTQLGAAVTRTFVIKNIGAISLDISNVTLGGNNANQFSVSQTPDTSVTPGDSTTFQLTYNPTALTASPYTANVSINNSDVDENPFNFSISGTTPAPPCTPTSYYGCNSMWIANVQLGTINNNSNCAYGNSYTDYSSMVANATVGSSVNFVITGGGNYALNYGLWIDLDDDGLFTGIGEYLGGFTNSSTIYSGSFTIPSNAPAGTHKLRIIGDYYGNGVPSNPCGNYSSGETEDYAINLYHAQPCSGTPSPGNTTSSVTTECPGTNFDLELDGSLLDGGITYQWQKSTNGSSWSHINGATSSTLSTSQNADHYYRCEVTCTNSGNAAQSTPVQVLNACPPCTPSHNYNCTYMWIASLQMGAISNTTGCNGGYSDYTNLSTTVQAGDTVAFSLTKGGYSLQYSVFFDIDGNGSYNDANEYMGTVNGNPATGAFIVPSNTSGGSHGVRFVSSYYNYATPTDPCGTYTYGETEDYTIIVTLPPPEINLTGNSQNIVSGQTATSTADHTDFGQVIQGQNQVRTFTIENSGSGPLAISAVNVGGANASEFAITSSPSSSVAAAGSTTFDVTFSPTATGSRTATISIDNDDSDENPYTFNMEGIGLSSTITWTGSVSTDISNAQNWSPNVVPTGLDISIDGALTNQPSLSGLTTFTVGDVSLSNNGNVTVNSPATLNIDGDFNGTGYLLGNGTMHFNSGTHTINDEVKTTLTIEVPTGATINSLGNLVLGNGASLMHGAGTPGGGGSVVGDIKVEKEGSTNPNKYNHWGAPVSGETISRLGATVYEFNEANNDATDFRNDWQLASGNMVEGKGYTAKGAGAVTFEGTAGNGNKTLNITKTSSSNVLEDGWNFVSNPYPSGLDAADFVNANPDIDGTLHFWVDPGTGENTYQSSHYATWNLSGSTSTGGGSVSPDGKIGSGQGFFVRKTNNGASSVNFTNAMRRGQNQQFFRTINDIQRIKLNITDVNGAFDEALIAFSPEASDGWDRLYDGIKMPGNGLTIFTELDDQAYGIQAWAPVLENKVIPVEITTTSTGEMTLNYEYENFESTVGLWLEDRERGVWVNLRKEDPYTFWTDEESAVVRNRFFVHINVEEVEHGSQAGTSTGIDLNEDLHMQAYSARGSVIVNSAENMNGEIRILNTLGQLVQAVQVKGTNHETIPIDFCEGNYLVEYISANSHRTFKLYITR